MSTRSGKMYALEQKFKELEVKSEKTEREAKKVKQHCQGMAENMHDTCEDDEHLMECANLIQRWNNEGKIAKGVDILGLGFKYLK